MWKIILKRSGSNAETWHRFVEYYLAQRIKERENFITPYVQTRHSKKHFSYHLVATWSLFLRAHRSSQCRSMQETAFTSLHAASERLHCICQQEVSVNTTSSLLMQLPREDPVPQSTSLIAVPVIARNGVRPVPSLGLSVLHARLQQEVSDTTASSPSMQFPQETISPSAAALFDERPEIFDPSLLTNFQLASFAVEQLWRAWHVATPSNPALKHICGKMITGENRTNDIRQLSRYTRVIDFITGTSKIPWSFKRQR